MQSLNLLYTDKHKSDWIQFRCHPCHPTIPAYTAGRGRSDTSSVFLQLSVFDMPALPSFITAGFKGKASGIGGRTPFYRRQEPTAPQPAPTPVQDPQTDIIDINNGSKHYSLDFDGGKPNDEFDKAIFNDTPRLIPTPQVKLDIDLSPEALTDWFTSNFLGRMPEGESITEGRGLRNDSLHIMASASSKPLNGQGELPLPLQDGRDDNLSAESSSEDVLANLQEMNPSHFGAMPGYDDFNRLDQSLTMPKNSSPKPASHSGNPDRPARPSLEAPSSYKTMRPVSTAEELLSSAVSGSTLARALMSNSFILPSENRASKFFRGAGGLTRSDSTTLPRSERNFGGPPSDESFSIGPDAPPVPSNAEALYRPPQIARTQNDEQNRSEGSVTRQTSGNSINVKALPKTPSVTSTRPPSELLIPGVEFDVTAIIPSVTPGSEARSSPSVPRSPLPLPPTPKLAYMSSEDGESSKQGSIQEEYQKPNHRLPADSRLNSPAFDQSSPAASSDGLASARDFENVLNYYSLPETPEMTPALGYQPAFSPISEESGSQLASPTLYRTGREATRTAPFGGRSPSNGSPKVIRQDSLTLPRRPSERSFMRASPSLLSVAEKARAATPPASSPNSISSYMSSGAHEILSPPPVSSIFTRPRGGSAPSPIKVIRDSKDATAYKITVSPQLLDPLSQSDEDGEVTQEFPETPNMFSPLLTGNTRSSSMMMPGPAAENAHANDIPSAPRSATLPRGGSQSAAQAMLLNRSGTTIAYSRSANSRRDLEKEIVRKHSPSNSIFNTDAVGVVANGAQVPDIDINAATALQIITDEADPVQEQTVHSGTGDWNRMSVASARYSRASSLAVSISQESDSSPSIYTPSVSSKSSRNQRNLPPIPSSLPSSPPAPSLSPSPAVSYASLPTQAAIAPPSTPTSIPPPLHIPSPPPSQPLPPPPIIDTSAQPPVARYIPPPPTIPPPSPTPSQKTRSSARLRVPPALSITNVLSSSANTVALNGPETTETSPEFSQPTQSAMAIPPTTIHPPNATSEREQPSISYKAGYLARDYDLFRGNSLGSPPPYYSVIRDEIARAEPAPNAAFAGYSFPVERERTNSPASAQNVLITSSPPCDVSPTRIPEVRSPGALGGHNSIVSQRSRLRPPLPAGPRRPSQAGLIGLPAHQLRDRSGSISSIGSTGLLMQTVREREASTSATDAPSLASPKFQTPPPKWRGYTMEAAKWTFTSAQLQAIVSRAIRQSAEASSIRLLRLEILDNDIPEEVRRLEAQRAELKSRYRVWARRRTALVDGLAIYMSASEDEAPAYAAHMVDDLRDVSMMLDKFAEELHSVDAQLAQLNSLVQIHSGSALAMALRKLNASFLRQVADNQFLRNQIQSLEAERDEAWQHAAEIANELDRMDSQTSSRRSSHISAVRKSSIRVSKAGLRTPSQRLSQLSSHVTLPKSPLARSQRVPPVPPILRHRPPELLTDLMSRTSTAQITSPGYTPTSETEALLEVQEELYSMLGIKSPERPRRSRSISIMSGGSSAAPSSAHHTFLHPMRSTDIPAISLHRRSSLPGNATLAEAYNAMAVDRNAVLATIDMLSSTD